MIKRSWHGAVPAENGDAFETYFCSHVLDEIARLPGNFGVFFRRFAHGGFEHFFLVTYWRDWAAIRAFAGDTPHIAVHYPEDARFGLIADPLVLHQDCTAIDPWHGE